MRTTEVELNSQETEEQSTGEFECEECGCNEVHDHTNEVICKGCGLIIDENMIDHGPEWRAFSSSERDSKSRVGAPVTSTMHDRGLTTVMGRQNTSGMSRRKKERLSRMREWDTRSKQTSKERGLKFSLGEINRITSALELSKSVQEISSVLFRRVHNEDLLPGRSYEGMSSACVYIACRQEGIPRTFDEISAVSRVKRQKIIRSYKKISQNIELEIGPPDPEKYISRFVTVIRENQKNKGNNPCHETYKELEKCTRYIVCETKEAGAHSGRSPATVVAGAIYLAQRKMGMGLTQDQVGSPCDVTQVSIRTMFHEQAEITGIDYKSSPTRSVSSSSNDKTYNIMGYGEVTGKKSKEFVKALLKNVNPEDIETDVTVDGIKVDFMIKRKYLVDISANHNSTVLKDSDKTYITFDDSPANMNVDWESYKLVAKRILDI